MTYEQIFGLIDAESLRPFRIQMTSDRTFDVRHPEMIRVGENAVVVFQYDKHDERLFESFKMLGFSLMESLEHLELQESSK